MNRKSFRLLGTWSAITIGMIVATVVSSCGGHREVKASECEGVWSASAGADSTGDPTLATSLELSGDGNVTIRNGSENFLLHRDMRRGHSVPLAVGTWELKRDGSQQYIEIRASKDGPTWMHRITPVYVGQESGNLYLYYWTFEKGGERVLFGRRQ